MSFRPHRPSAFARALHQARLASTGTGTVPGAPLPILANILKLQVACPDDGHRCDTQTRIRTLASLLERMAA